MKYTAGHLNISLEIVHLISIGLICQSFERYFTVLLLQSVEECGRRVCPKDKAMHIFYLKLESSLHSQRLMDYLLTRPSSADGLGVRAPI